MWVAYRERPLVKHIRRRGEARLDTRKDALDRASVITDKPPEVKAHEPEHCSRDRPGGVPTPPRVRAADVLDLPAFAADGPHATMMQ